MGRECGVGLAFSQKASPKTVEIRSHSEELVYLDHRRLPVSALRKGSKFLYVEHLLDNSPLVLLMEVTADPCTFDSRGHAVAQYKELALPESLLQQFSSRYDDFSVAFGNDFYHRCISRRRDEFIPEQHERARVLAFRVRALGVVRRAATALPALVTATDSTAFTVLTGLQDSNEVEPEDSVVDVECTPPPKVAGSADVGAP